MSMTPNCRRSKLLCVMNLRKESSLDRIKLKKTVRLQDLDLPTLVLFRKANLFSDSFQQRGIGNHQVNVQSLSSLRNLREKILD